jgi:hypothetical protein
MELMGDPIDSLDPQVSERTVDAQAETPGLMTGQP